MFEESPNYNLYPGSEVLAEFCKNNISDNNNSAFRFHIYIDFRDNGFRYSLENG